MSSKILCPRAVAAASLLASLALTACGRTSAPSGGSSDLLWTQSRAGTERYAYLDNADLQDTFLLGASVINVNDFISNALNMTVNPVKVKLSVAGNKLNVKPVGSNETILSFNVRTVAGKKEIDFESAGNDVNFSDTIDYLGGVYTASDEKGLWVSEAAPEVLSVQQDKDTVVVDLLHTVVQVVAKIDAQGNPIGIDHQVSDHAGKVVVRLYLKRQRALPEIGDSVARTVQEGRSKTVGFFGSVMARADNPDEDTSLIQRFPLGDAKDAKDSVTFYLKDVPAQFQDTARAAILSWNKAFGRDVLKVEIAPENVDAGDPRYHVVKWFDGTDHDVSWAGVAKMSVDPDSGVVMSGTLYIQGNTLVELYRKITAFTAAASSGNQPAQTGSIGGAHFAQDLTEAPVVPYFTDTTKTFDEYIQGYYLDTIMHEVGHTLGLRHNFKGSTELDQQSMGASIMDYEPRAERNKSQGPGVYDIAAIRWGYFGEAPSRVLPNCTDEEMWTKWDCSQGDHGDALDYTIKGLKDGTAVLTQKAIPVDDDDLISSMTTLVDNALKIKKLKDQLDPTQRAKADAELDDAYNYLYNAGPAAGLSADDLTVVTANLTKLHDMARKEEQLLKDQGHI